jgi:integrase
MAETSQRLIDRRLYDYEFALKDLEKLLKHDPKVRDEDRRLIRAFERHVRAQGVSTGRLAKLVNHIRRCAQLMPVPFAEAKRRDIEELMTRLSDFEWIQRRPDGTVARRTRYSPATMADFRHILKRFMKFVRYGNTDFSTPYPDEVKWISSAIKQSDRREPDYFTDAEAEAMIKAATSLRDKAIISLWAELGGKPSEILLLRVGDIQFDDAGALVHITRGKTGPRTLRAISCVKHLTAHLETHSLRQDPEAPLWLSSSANHATEPLSWVVLSRMVKVTARRAGIMKKRIHGYMFRHGSATRNSKYFTDSELKRMYGWSMASRSPAVYIHLSAADVDTRYQQVYGKGKTVEPPKLSLGPVICPRCGEKASPGMLYCPKCATPLDPAERAKNTAREQSLADEVRELRELVGKLLAQRSKRSTVS